MARKVVLNDMATGYASITTYNNNNASLMDAVDNTLSRDGTGPNQMEAVLDMNSNRIINLPTPQDPTDAVRLQDLSVTISTTTGSSVSSIGILRALTGTAVDTVLVKGYYAAGDGGGGNFYYDSTDTTTVDNGATVIVDGSGHRYKRIWDGGWFNFLWAGAVADGVGLTGTDNSAAILRTTYLGRLASDAGKGFNLLLPPGQYNFTGANTGYWWWSGIKKFHVSAYGATLQNTYAGGDGNLGRPLFSVLQDGLMNQSGATFHGVVAGNALSWLINSTTVGATSITTTTAADAGAWSVGEPILLTAVDTEYVGYPPNPALFEFNEVVTVDAGTGIITLKRPVENAYLSTYPDGGITGAATVPCGKGRAWKLSSTVAGVPIPLSFPTTQTLTLPWDIDHLYEGLTLPQCPGNFATYMTISGKNVHFKDCTLIGISPSIAGTTRFTNCEFTLAGEPDKLVERVILDECHSTIGIGFQSSSVNHVEVNGGYYKQFYWGTAKYVTINNPNIDQLLFGSLYGVTRNVVINGGTIRSAQAPWGELTGNPSNIIDGTNVSYAAGVISILKSSAAQAFYWGLVPGQQINLTAIADSPSVDAGIGIVTSLTENATHILIGTTWPWATVAAAPFASTGKVRPSRGPPAIVNGTTGCDFVRGMAAATLLGKKPWEYFGAQLVNFNTAGGSSPNLMYGSLTNFNVNVQQITSTATRTIAFSTYLVKRDTYDDQKLLVITIDLRTIGKRKFDLSAVTLLGTDTITFNGVGVTALPPDRVVSASTTWLHNITVPGTSATIPIVTFEAITDGGMQGSPLSYNLDNSTNPITNITGLVPS